MLSTAIELQERLFVEKNLISTFTEGFLEDLHGDQVLINSFTSVAEDWSKLVLVESDLTMLGLESNTNLEELFFNLPKDLFDLCGDLSIVMIRELLIFGSNNSQKSSTTESQVRSVFEILSGNDEKFLLKAEVKKDISGFFAKLFQKGGG